MEKAAASFTSARLANAVGAFGFVPSASKAISPTPRNYSERLMRQEPSHQICPVLGYQTPSLHLQ